jgi:hypothetical protein
LRRGTLISARAGCGLDGRGWQHDKLLIQRLNDSDLVVAADRNKGADV